MDDVFGLTLYSVQPHMDRSHDSETSSVSENSQIQPLSVSVATYRICNT